MIIDKTTLYDLSIFDHNEEQSLLHHIDFCKTNNGRTWLEHCLKNPLLSVKEIIERQQLLKRIIEVQEDWPVSISNGSVLMIEKFYESQVGMLPSHANVVNSSLYKVFNAGDYSLVKYSVSHFIDFLQGMSKIYDLLNNENNPAALDVMLQRIKILLNKPIAQQIIQYKKSKQLSKQTVLHFGFFIRNHYRQDAQDLIEIYSRLDAFYSMAKAHVRYNFSFP